MFSGRHAGRVPALLGLFSRQHSCTTSEFSMAEVAQIDVGLEHVRELPDGVSRTPDARRAARRRCS